ncbi:hypothetical protein [Microbacterium sp. MYb64]|uniref:hypothetical protein n=1 Tax=Microbacterium sp. MYb64 TaxID=1848691 RepID=UPI000CFDCF6A|nr:hypothetical protein [Microbacterium sp. MYb64]PRB01758.1 hypothetical protein CQ044_16550 [Microbacterium sp. MYb64]
MARATLTPAAFVLNGALTDPTGTATGVGAGNGATVPYGGSKTVILRIVAAGAGTATVVAGSQPSAIASGQGNATVTFGGAGTQWAGPFESARFGQPDGSLAVDTSVAMTVTAFTLDGRYVG